MQTMTLQQQKAQSELMNALKEMTPSSGSKATSAPVPDAVRPPASRTVSLAAPSRKPPYPSPKTKFYAVAKGRETGIFTSWKRVLNAISGMPYAKYKRFTNRTEAEDWLAEQLVLLGVIPPDEDLSEDDGASEYDTVIYDQSGLGKNRTVRPNTVPIITNINMYPPPPPNPSKELVDFRMSAPDTSVGKPDEICDVSINVSTAVRDLLCPKGLTQEMQNRLVEVVPDVLAAPGKLTSSMQGDSPDPNIYDHFAEALADLADVNAQHLGSHRRDTQWKSGSRNYLAKIGSADAAIETVTQLMAMHRELFESLTAALLTEVLLNAGWTFEDALIYCKSGGLVILVTRTLDDYCALLLFATYKVLRHSENWNHVSKIYVDHHASKLALIRLLSRRREHMLYRNYTYLRDARAANFQTLSIVSKLAEHNLASILSPVENKDKKTATKWECTHCHGKFYTGGSAKCDLADLPTKAAREVAKGIDKKIADGGTEKSKIVADAIKENKEK
jgi:hypothetical protein